MDAAATSDSAAGHPNVMDQHIPSAVGTKRDAAKESKGKRKRPEMEAVMLSQTNFYLQPSLYVKGNQLNFSKSADNQSVARKRAEESDGLRREEKRRLVDSLLGKQEERIRRAGGKPWDPTEPSAGSSVNSSRKQSPSIANEADTTNAAGNIISDGTSAIDTRMPEPLEAEFAQELETALSDFPTKNLENGQVPALQILNDETIIIHPGSRYLKIGRGSDLTPISIPNCIYRKTKTSKQDGAEEEPEKAAEESISASSSRLTALSSLPSSSSVAEQRERDSVIASLRVALRERMRLEKLKLPAGKADQPIQQVTRYNSSQKPIQYKPHDDPYGVDWLEDYSANILFPDKNLWIAEDAPYELWYPIRNRTFNTCDYGDDPTERILSDVQDILQHALSKLNPPVSTKDLWKYSVALIVPDHTDKAYIEGMCTVLLQRMGFRQCGVLQESLCATFGAGLSSACVVDIGAERTSVACVDDGLLLGETRHILHFGRDDVTSFYADLLRRVSFPYHELNLNRRLDWQMMDELTTRTCTLLDHLVAFNVWKLQVRHKGSPTTEYQLQTFDQPVLAPACFFDPRVLDWSAKVSKTVVKRIKTNYEDDSMPDLKDDGTTLAMAKSTEHLLPPAPPPIPQDPVVTVTVNPETGEETTTTFQPEPIQLPAPAPSFDVVEVAGKMPIDFAVANSLMAAGADFKSANLANAILVLGGGALIEGISPALAWRYLATSATATKRSGSTLRYLERRSGVDETRRDERYLDQAAGVGRDWNKSL
ncbi:hypothetical protein QFC19_003988 [Naganishia cerealis]|uniref:Uncharacterized protein n=1 Tax=Naganishia cerealis TaxID=610337 RepID=A0ACC2VYW6_9TREE|nr:hypothetical protein QFC19_003988 [Naganishia cerealis]